MEAGEEEGRIYQHSIARNKISNCAYGMQPPGYPGGKPKPKDWALTGRGAAPVKPPWLVKQLPPFPPLTLRLSSDGVQMGPLGSLLFRVDYGSRLALFRIALDELVAIAALLQVGLRGPANLKLPGAQQTEKFMIINFKIPPGLSSWKGWEAGLLIDCLLATQMKEEPNGSVPMCDRALSYQDQICLNRSESRALPPR